MNRKNMIKFALPCLAAMMSIGMISARILTHPPQRPIGFVRKFKPDVSLIKNDEKHGVSRAQRLYSGDTLSTNDHGFALVQFIDKSIAKIKPNSELVVRGQISGKQNSSTRINVAHGELFLQVTKRSSTNFEVASNTSVAAVKGTRFGAREDNYYWVIEGIVAVTSQKSGKTVSITKHEYAKVRSDGTIESGELSEGDIEELQKDYDQFDDILTPSILTLRYRDENGQVKTMNLKYFENNER